MAVSVRTLQQKDGTHPLSIACPEKFTLLLSLLTSKSAVIPRRLLQPAQTELLTLLSCTETRFSFYNAT